jgi:hypothetical protein
MAWRWTTWTVALALALALAPAAWGADGGTPVPDLSLPAPGPTSAPGNASIRSDGRAVAPRAAPAPVRRVMTAANRLVKKPYRWGGGHRAFASGVDRAYDCSGAVSYALYGARLLTAPLDSTALARFGRPGPGLWLTVYANRRHAFLVVAGLRFDTGGHDASTTPSGTGPRWSASTRSPRGYAVRHPDGL